MRRLLLAIAALFVAALPARADFAYQARCIDGPGLQFNFYHDGVAGILYIKTPTGIVQLASYHRLISDKNGQCFATADVAKVDTNTSMLCAFILKGTDRSLAVQIGPVYTPSAVNTICKADIVSK